MKEPLNHLSSNILGGKKRKWVHIATKSYSFRMYGTHDFWKWNDKSADKLKIIPLSTTVSWLTMLSLPIFFWLWWHERDTHSVETELWIWIRSSPRLLIGWPIHSWDAGQWHSSRQPRDREGTQPLHLQPARTHSTVLFFICSRVFSKFPQLLNTLL